LPPHEVVDEKRGFYGTRQLTLLESVPLGVTASTSPVVAPVTTVVVISELETTENVAAEDCRKGADEVEHGILL
jgi:hypothetical protein